MKKIIIVLICTLMPLASYAHDIEINGIYYNLIEKGEIAEVTYMGDTPSEYKKEYSGSVTIPSTITYNEKTYYVTSIGAWAFYDCSDLTSIIIPNSITNIGSSAFMRCTGLTSLNIPSSITSIGSNAFFECYALTAVYISDITSWCYTFFANYCANPLLYAHHLYLNNEEVTNLIIPNSVTRIGIGAFRGCSSLISVTISNAMTSIEDYAFSECM